MIRKSPLIGCAAILAAALATAPINPAMAQGKKIVIAAPGIPPVFASTILYVAEKQGMFKKYGVDVEIKPFDTGATASRAVIAGDIEISLSPSALLINQISNTGAPVVAIYGITNTDFLLATTEASKTCKDAAGQGVGVDTVGGARSIALRIMLANGCPGLTIDNVQQVALSSNVGAAMLAGRLQFGVLHLDDVATLELQGKKVNTLLTVNKTSPNNHYLVWIVRQDKLKENRDAYVRVMAALHEAAIFIHDPKNWDKVAEDAAPTGLDKAVAKATIKPLLDIDYWPVNDNGLDRKRLEALTQVLKKTGGIKADKEPVTYDRLVDASVWNDAVAMTKK
ncbi:MAG TPA: ABC transporter substrate-binding protein [Xanthobacteraceae bacterium]|nr:ABC transporter substrate-binding protein [Xanthobacteraceae bacterium]